MGALKRHFHDEICSSQDEDHAYDQWKAQQEEQPSDAIIDQLAEEHEQKESYQFMASLGPRNHAE